VAHQEPRDTRHPTYITFSQSGERRFGVYRRWVYDKPEEKIALYVDSNPPANTRWTAYTDAELSDFIEDLYQRFKDSPLWNWYSRSSTWASTGQVFLETSAWRLDSEYVQEKELFAKQVYSRATTKPKEFFRKSVEQLVDQMLKRYNVHLIHVLGVRLLHGKRT
jgi:hypothetical protein